MAFGELKRHIIELVSHMRADVTSGGKKNGEAGLKAALMRNLVEANMTQGDYKRLADDELLSNIFVRFP
jgi:hypothetical protein